ncbi:MAG TPA: methyltransferase domain-containing protein [Methyloceanibacter sp.]|nr:methyltransferase domain-containing protein [Methyloceanibacter sp.]
MTKSLAQQRFGRAAADYATSEVHAKGASLARLVELTEPKPHWRVLDVATGAGHTAFAFAPHVAKVTATDITEEMLAETRKLAKARGLTNVKALTAKAEDLPFPDASFDLVVCRLAAHHFRKIGDFLSEAFRVLMPGGTLGIVDNLAPDAAIAPGRDADELRHGASLFNAFKKLSDPSHVRCLGLLEWQTLLADAGFTVTHEECLDKEIEFGTWVQRMRSSEATTARLKEMLREEPLRDFLKPRETASGPDFTLKEGFILARKPR